MTATYKGVVPDTFKNDAEVVLKGTLSPEGFSVAPNGVMAKCPSKYEPHRPARRPRINRRPWPSPAHMASLGALVLVLTFVTAAYAAAASIAGARRRNNRLIESGIGAFYTVAALMTVASGLIIYAFVAGDYSIKYVQRYSDSVQPLFYKITSYWGGLDGSVMFWVFLLSVFGTVAVKVNRERHRELIPYVVGDHGDSGDVLSLPDAVAQQPVRHLSHRVADRRRRAQPAAAELLHGDSSAD